MRLAWSLPTEYGRGWRALVAVVCKRALVRRIRFYVNVVAMAPAAKACGRPRRDSASSDIVLVEGRKAECTDTRVWYEKEGQRCEGAHSASFTARVPATVMFSSRPGVLNYTME